MLRQAIEFTCGIAQENLINRGVDSLFESLSVKHNHDCHLENMDSNFTSLMARADDVEKETSIKVEQGRKRKREVEVWLEDVKKVEGEYHAFVEAEERKGFMRKIFGGCELAKQLHARICHLDERSRLFGELVVADDSARGLPRPTAELEGAEFKNNFEKIWNLLENDQVSSIGVHGMGGVGKSTLVTHIHNQLLGRNKCVLWVVVSSQRCSIKMLQDKIARKLGVDLSGEEDDVGVRAGRLNEALSQRGSFVLILDDVWECIDLVKLGLPLSMEGCKWMITSRSLKVCQEMNCQERIVVKPLGEDEGWKLFLKNLGQDATSALRDPQVEGIAKRTVEICDGLPLGIITLAGAMSGVTKIQEWRHALGVLKKSAMEHEQMEEKVFPVLQYSFDRLNPNDQCCFLYCSLYPEDHIMLIETLLDNFISDKLVDESKSRAAQRDEGHSIVTRLVKVSLLESVYDSMENECVKMHDLVRGMALKITKGKTMIISGERFRKEIPTEEEWTEDLVKVSLMMNQIQEIPDGQSPNCPKLTTLLLQKNPLNWIATSFFSQMCGLSTLNISHTYIKELPDSVSEMVNLRSLLLKRCIWLQHVPCVRKLKELRELDLSETAIADVPQGLEELLNIRFLSMAEAHKLLRTSVEFKSARLQVLHLPENVHAELLEGGEWLEMFTGRLKHMSDFNRVAASKQDGISYHVVVGGPGHRLKYLESDENVTRKLIVYACNLKGIERTILAADYVQYLEFDMCEGMSKCLLDDLNNPAFLQELRIYNSGGTECILTYDQFKAAHSQSRFQALERIELHNLDDFTSMIQNLKIEADLPPSAVFSSLTRLDISHCNKMKQLGLPLSVFEKLEYISIQECEDIEGIIQVAPEDDGGGALLISLPNLMVLSLVGLPSLKSFCNAPVICSSIMLFRLENCPQLEVPFNEVE